MRSDDTVLIPLRARDGTVRAYTVVDAVDAERVIQYRWSLNRGYARRTDFNDGCPRLVLLHRVIMGLEHGDPFQVDHIDRDRLNNRRSNLRVLPPGANSQNIPKRPGHSSAYRGVSWNRNRRKWRARITFQGQDIFLGHFADELSAAAAAAEARQKWMPYAVE